MKACSHFFSNDHCEFFPCHKVADSHHFNCLFCYCPLYVLGSNCGGHFSYLEDGTKDCSDCLYPHLPENYVKIITRYPEIKQVLQRIEEIQK